VLLTGLCQGLAKSCSSRITGNSIFHFSDLRVNQDLSAPDSIGVGKGDGAPSSVGVRSERVEIPQNKYSDSQ
jgi:hypothetical protein